jgi:tetratricopeptide (TPR) repeat protein
LAEDEQRPSGEVRGEAAAEALALGAASRDRADRFLDEQTRVAQAQVTLLHLQAEDLRREDRLRHWSLRVHHISDVLKLGFELAAALVVTAIAAFIGAAVWSAAHDHGLVIEAFAVPADMAANGLSGQVVATQVQDRLAWMQDHTDTIRQANSYANNWANDVKVQIPDTGVSIGEFYRYLTGWLGNQTHITGEVWRDGGRIALSVRIGSDAAHVFTGAPSDVSSLVAKAAEDIYGRTQPYRYAVFLGGQGRSAEAMRALQALALNGPAEEKPWAYSRWSVQLANDGDVKGAFEKERIAAALGPDLPHLWGNLAGDEAGFGHDEAALRDNERAIALLDSPKAGQLAAYAVNADRIGDRMIDAEARGDFQRAAALAPELHAAPDYSNSRVAAQMMLSADLASDHDVAASRRIDPQAASETGALEKAAANDVIFNMPPLPSFLRAAMLDDWNGARDDLAALERSPPAQEAGAKPLLPVLIWPWLAYADARLGDVAVADALIAKTPRDCYLCVRMRGNIAATEKNWHGATRWFADAAKQGPSLPFAYADWGAMLLRKGDLDGAIAKFQTANQKGPHFADPLEMWGEALMQKNRSDLALPKFEEADKYAPNWGRLHLKWGEALSYTGEKSEAKKQFFLAGSLDLSASDKSELTKASAAHG